MTLDDFFHALREANRTKPDIHTLHPRATQGMIEEWQRRYGLAPPEDLIHLLRCSNGVGIHQEWYNGEPIYAGGMYVFYPLEEIEPAVTLLYGRLPQEEPAMATWFAFGQGPDGSVYFVFDAVSRHFLTMAPIVPDEAEDLGPSIAPILDLVAPAISA